MLLTSSQFPSNESSLRLATHHERTLCHPLHSVDPTYIHIPQQQRAIIHHPSIMLTDQSKLFLLLACLSICLGTFWTSHAFPTTTITTGEADVRLHTSPKFCNIPRATWNACTSATSTAGSGAGNGGTTTTTSSSTSTSTCTTQFKMLTTCENVVQKAYRHINMAGCPSEIQAVHRCESEWCSKDDGEPVVCQKECQVSRKVLEECVKRHVHRWFQKHGLDVDGTIAGSSSSSSSAETKQGGFTVIRKDRNTSVLGVSGSSHQTSSSSSSLKE